MTASPTPLFAESAKKSDAVPSEEIRRIIDDAMNSAISEPWEVSAHATARLEALFAPILAEKEHFRIGCEKLSVRLQIAKEERDALKARALAAEAALAAERERCAELRDIVLDALHDMDISGLSVCGQVKYEMRYLLGPMDGSDEAPEYSYDQALAALIEIDEMHGKPSGLREEQRARAAAIRAQGQP